MSRSTFELSIDYVFIHLNIKKVSSLVNWKEKWNRPMLIIKNIVILFLVSVECITFGDKHMNMFLKLGIWLNIMKKCVLVFIICYVKKYLASTKISSNDSHLDLYNLSHKFINILWHFPLRNLCNSRILKWTIQWNMNETTIHYFLLKYDFLFRIVLLCYQSVKYASEL